MMSPAADRPVESGLTTRRVKCFAVLLPLLIVSMMAGASACGGGADDVETFRGLIVDVAAESLLELTSLTVEAENGTRLTFETRSTAIPGFSPSHLREHMVLGLLVTVTFHRDNGAYVLDDLTD